MLIDFKMKFDMTKACTLYW